MTGIGVNSTWQRRRAQELAISARGLCRRSCRLALRLCQCTTTHVCTGAARTRPLLERTARARPHLGLRLCQLMALCVPAGALQEQPTAVHAVLGRRNATASCSVCLLLQAVHHFEFKVRRVDGHRQPARVVLLRARQERLAATARAGVPWCAWERQPASSSHSAAACRRACTGVRQQRRNECIRRRRTCVKKKALIQKTGGGPRASQASKNARRSSTSRTYAPSGFRLGKLRRSHSDGTWHCTQQQAAGSRAEADGCAHVRCACMLAASTKQHTIQLHLLPCWRPCLQRPALHCIARAHLAIKQRPPQRLQLAAHDRQAGTRLAQRAQAGTHHAQQAVEPAQLLQEGGGVVVVVVIAAAAEGCSSRSSNIGGTCCDEACNSAAAASCAPRKQHQSACSHAQGRRSPALARCSCCCSSCWGTRPQRPQHQSCAAAGPGCRPQWQQ